MGRAFLSSSMITMIGVACAFVTQLLLARILSPDAYGVFSFISSLSILIGVFALFGFQNSLVRLISGEAGQAIRAVAKFSIVFTFVLAVVFGVLAFGALYVLGYGQTYGASSFVIGGVLVVAFVGLRMAAALMRGMNFTAQSVLYESGLREILLLAGLGAVLLLGGGIDTGAQALMILAVAGIVAALIGLGHSFYRVLKCGVDEAQPAQDWRYWLKISFPMMLVIVAQRMMRRCDIVILGLMVSPSLVGAYAIAAQFADVSGIGQKVVYAIFGPRAAALYKAGDLAALRQVYNQVRWYGIFYVAGLSLLIAIGAPFVLGFFGAGYGAGYYALLILLAGQLINMCYGPVGLLMIMSAYENQAMRYTGAAALANVVLNPVAILFWGLEGAALVTAVSIVIRGAVSYRFVRKQGLV
jgi:O-antigen/teichoic acid export membrane protein